MKILFLSLVFAGSAYAQQAGVSIPIRVIAHPKQAFHAVSGDKKWLALATLVLEDVNAIDYATTRRGAFPGTGGCELNPLLVSAPCQIDVPRFTGVKIGVAAVGIAEWIPIWTRQPWAGNTYTKIFTLLDFLGAVPLAAADVNNIHQLTK